jgi:peptidyl-prolyl cis-trans isomerase A (cyclophilin A)
MTKKKKRTGATGSPEATVAKTDQAGRAERPRKSRPSKAPRVAPRDEDARRTPEPAGSKISRSTYVLGGVLIALVAAMVFFIATADEPEADTIVRAEDEAPRPDPPARPTPDEPSSVAPGSRLPGQAPPEYDVTLDTTKGPIRIHVTRAWAPHGADRFYELVQSGYFTDVAFFRVIEGFMAQAGMHGDPTINARWSDRSIPDDPVVASNTPGMVTFAASSAPNSRSSQFFINLENNQRLDAMGFAPFGRTDDLAVVRALHSGYGEGAPSGRGPEQGRIAREGNAYLRAEFPELDYIRSASVTP